MKEELEFYDVKTRSKFKSSNWRIEIREKDGTKRYFAVAPSPNGTHEAWRTVGADFAKQNA